MFMLSGNACSHVAQRRLQQRVPFTGTVGASLQSGVRLVARARRRVGRIGVRSSFLRAFASRSSTSSSRSLGLQRSAAARVNSMLSVGWCWPNSSMLT